MEGNGFQHRIRAAAREPLLHFLILAGLLFAGHQLLAPLERPTIRIGQAAIEVVFASYLSNCRGERVTVPVADNLRVNPSRAWAGLPVVGELPE